jgi:NADP-dependent 3-hydroxy acid dehydrogenase YdfG
MSITNVSEDPAPETGALPHSLAGQKVLVAGGGHHMGLAVVRAAAAAGASVVVIGRDRARSERAAELAMADGAQEAVSEQCDVSDAGAVEALLEGHAGFDHLAITISTGGSVTTIDATPVEAAREPFDNRFWPTYGLLHAASRHMAPAGSIVFTSGSSGRRPQVGLGIYGTLHAALNMLALAAAIELAPLRVAREYRDRIAALKHLSRVTSATEQVSCRRNPQRATRRRPPVGSGVAQDPPVEQPAEGPLCGTPANTRSRARCRRPACSPAEFRTRSRSERRLRLRVGAS